MSSPDERLSLLLLRWYQLREEGKILTAPELCADCPELAEALALQIHGVQSLEGRYRLADDGDSFSVRTEASPPEKIRAACAPPVVPGYEILGPLGRGGMGIVSQARHLALKRLVALKQILAGPHAAPAQLARFRTEAEAVARLQHAAIVQIYEVGEHDGQPYLALEFVEGGTLAQKLQQAPLAPPDAARMVETLARAVHYAHERGIVHRDLKPANVLLTADRQPKITDFGLAKRLDAETGQTQSGTVLGTPSYMAPEQVHGKPAEVGPLADVYALGAILYDCLTGRPPVRGASLAETLQQVLNQEPVPPRQLQPKVPRDLETICLKCLDKDPRRRYPSAAALAEDLRRFSAREPIQARPTSLAERAWKWARRRPAVAALVVVGSAVVLGLPLLGWWSNLRMRTALARQEQELRAEQADLAAGQEKLIEQNRELARRSQEAADREHENSQMLEQRAGIDAATRLLREGRYPEAVRALGPVPDARRGWEWYRMLREASRVPHGEEVFAAHDWAVAALCGTRDGRLLASSGHDGRVLCWDVAAGTYRELEAGIESDQLRRWCHAFLPWAHETTVAPDCFADLCWLQDGVLLAGASYRRREVVLWDLRNGKREVRLRHNEPLCALAASADGQHLLAGDERGTLLYLDRRHGNWQTRSLPGGAVLRLVFVPPDSWAVGRADGTLQLIDLQAAQVLARQEVAGPIWDLGVAPREGLLAVACQQDAIPVFLVEKKRNALYPAGFYKLPEAEHLSRRAAHTVRFSPDAKQLAAGDDLGRLILWQRGQAVPRLAAPNALASMVPPDRLADLPLPFRRRSAGLWFTPDGGQLFTAGSDTAIKRWPMTEQSDAAGLTVGADPHVCFDPESPRFLWVGAADGTLALIDSRTGAVHQKARVHSGGVRGLATAAGAGLVGTAGDDGVIRLWRREAQGFVAAGGPITHGRGLVSVALSPDGRRIAAYDFEDTVWLWHAGTELPCSLPMNPTGGPVTGASVVGWLAGPCPGPAPIVTAAALLHRARGPAYPGLVAFNCDGSTLAAAGPFQHFWLLSGKTLAVRDKPDGVVAAGAGATAVAWHPIDPGQLVAGDPLGRVYFYPPLGPARPGYQRPDWPHRVASLTFSPQSDRLAVAYRDGTVSVHDYRGIGLVFARATGRTDLARLLFDPEGRRLLLVHRDGHVTVWETADTRATPVVGQRLRPWRSRTLAEDMALDRESLKPSSVALDPRGRVAVLYSLPKRSGDTAQRHPVLVRETAESSVIDDLPGELLVPDAWGGKAKTIAHEGGIHPTSLALLVQGEELIAALRWPRTDVDRVAGQLVLLRKPCSADAGWTMEPVEGPENWGFQTQLFPRADGKPVILHFSYDTQQLIATRWDGRRWTSTPVGRFGDGNGYQAVAGPDGVLHLGFNPRRFGGDPSPVTYLRVGGPAREAERRETVTTQHRSAFAGITVTPDAQPVIAYSREEAGRNPDLVIARRQASGWDRHVLFANTAAERSNPACDDQGTLLFALAEGGRCLLLVTGSDRDRRAEVVWEAEGTEDWIIGAPVLLLDAHQQSVIVATGTSANRRWLRVFRPAGR